MPARGAVGLNRNDSGLLRQRAVELNRAALESEKQHDYAAAEAALEQARALWPQQPNGILPEMHAAVLGNLADACEFTGNWTEAAAVLEEAASLWERVWGASDARTTRLEVRLAEAEVVLGRFTSADARLQAALDRQRKTSEVSKTELAQTLASVSVLDVNIGRVREAEECASEAVALAGGVDSQTVEYGSIVGVLAGVFVVERQNARALPLLTRSIDILESRSPDSVRLAPELVQRGLIEAGDHKYTLAERDMQRAVAILDGANGPNVNADWARLHLARLYLAEQKLDEAEAIIPATVERQRAFLGGPGRRLAMCIRELARLRAMQKRWDEAVGLYREALNMGGGRSDSDLPAKAGASHKRATEKDVRALEQQASLLLDRSAGG